MKSIYPAILLACLYGCASAPSNLPTGAIQKGTLSNQKLIMDTMVGVAGKLGSLSCKEKFTFEPYVMSLPQGNIGSRVWRELWVVKACGTEHPMYIKFNESGLNAADYVVE